MEQTALRFESLVAEQQRAYEPFQQQFEAVGPRAERQWQQLVRESAEHYSSAAKKDAAFASRGMKPWLEKVSADRDYLAGLEEFKDVMGGIRLDVRENEGFLGFQTLDLMTQDEFMKILVLALGGFEESLDVFGRPFAHAGTEIAGGQHQQQVVSADKNAGTMRYAHVIGHEGGDAYIAAALWVDFMRRSPGSPPGQGNPGLAQVRAYVPYFNRWDTQSFVAPAHNHAGFGIFVRSEDLSGGDARTDLDHRYLWLDDSTDWYKHHSNPAAPQSDHDIALSYNNAAPYFVIRPGRIYSAAVWCFGYCDAHGATIEQASFAGSAVSASVPFIVVAQSKN